jgi:hypothetical protein
MGILLKMRSVVLSLLEKLKGTSAQFFPRYAQSERVSCRHSKNSFEADVDIILPDGLSVRPYFLQLIGREGGHFHFPISPRSTVWCA